MYITEEELKGFDTYKYSSLDTSPLSKYVMHPFWNHFVKVFPMWVAPNLMTFAGFLLVVLQTVVLTWYDPYFYASAKEMPEYPTVPTWVWWLCVFTQFFSHTLDGCDGKQARRTGSSSPMGELFDHGIDSWMVSLMAFGIFSIFGRGEHGATIWELYSILWMLMACFLFSHWEKYNTGILYLPWAYDMSQVLMAIVYAVTAVLGFEFWAATIFGFRLRDCIIIFIHASGFLFSIPMCLYNVHKSYTNKTGKMRTTYEAAVPLISPVLAFLFFTFWCWYSPGDILAKQPRWMLTANGVVFSNIVCRLIVSQMSNNRCQVLNFLLLPLLAAIFVTFFFNDVVIEFWCLITLTVLLILLHVTYAIAVVNQLADHLGIKVFSIKSPDHKD